MAAFDVVINNTDRKGGHCLRALAGGAIFGIDHGVSFHTQWKLRTVIWDFGGESIPPGVCRDLCALLDRSGYPTRRTEDVPGSPQWYVDDPFGNRIELVPAPPTGA